MLAGVGKILGYTLILLPFALLYSVLEHYLGDSWLVVGLFVIVLVGPRAGLYQYRKSKGIKDTWPHD